MISWLPPQYSKWVAFGTGVGIEIGRADLNVLLVKSRPQGSRILGSLTVRNFREDPASDWGRHYAEFLQKQGAGHLSATVLLPRDEVIVRQIAMPGVAEKDIGPALRFQLDSLHPFPEDDVLHSWARIGKTGDVVVGIVRRSIIGRYSVLFEEAGVNVAAFSFSAAGFYAAVRFHRMPPAQGFLTLFSEGGSIEAYGESEARPLFSATLIQSEDRARDLALAELRLPPETQPLLSTELLPPPLEAPEGFEFSRETLPYAAALAGACPWLALPINLLPDGRRHASSRAMFIPTIALLALVLLGAGALWAHSAYENQRYLDELQAQIRQLEPLATRAGKVDREIAVTRNHIEMLDRFRARSKDDLDALNDLTRLLVPPAWLQVLDLTRKDAAMTGNIDQAAGLLKLLDSSPQFQDSQFTSPLQRTGDSEVFRIHTLRREPPR
ncbi:MAG: hypothetical protein ACRD4P_18230 [Bryobacteraceae bacterium]